MGYWTLSPSSATPGMHSDDFQSDFFGRMEGRPRSQPTEGLAGFERKGLVKFYPTVLPWAAKP